ncbi:DUF2946 domain-containing protein [Sulfuricella denitrificans]|uniref:DUF2946 domain-containing protein n=1 Tax=Sulfuricella denitrificans TaxID=649841 RepID=UPI000A04412B|nr:DUF2946 domain-containing protein [Sulfuricella denitrificans]
MRFQTLRRFVILALFAMVFNALAATVTYAIAAGKGVVVVEMCSSFGLKKIAISTTSGDTRHSPSSVPTAKHCPFCLSPDHATVVFQTADSPPPIFISVFLPSVMAAWAPVHDPQSLWIASLKQEPPVRS